MLVWGCVSFKPIDEKVDKLSRSLKTPTEKDAARQKATFQKATLRAQKAKVQQKQDYSRDKTRKYSSAQQTEKHQPHNPRIQKIPAVSKHRDELTHERKTDKQQNIKSRKTRTSLKHVEDAISRFRDIVSTGPTYACFSCSRFLFRSSVTCFNQKCFTKLNQSFLQSIIKSPSPEHHLWICHQCSTCLKKNQMPSLCTANSLSLEVIPKELRHLTSLELQLISKILPFMKIVAKPTGAQTGIRGQVVLVPADISKVTTNLPRPTSHSQIITLALKRRLSDKHPFHEQFIRPQNVNAALNYLKRNSPFYTNVTVNEAWETFSAQHNPEFWTCITNQEQNMSTNSNSSSDSEHMK